MAQLDDIIVFIAQNMLIQYSYLMDPKVALHKHIYYNHVQFYY